MSAHDERLVEAILFAAAEPLSVVDIAARAPDVPELAAVLSRLRGLYLDRGVNLVEIGGRWGFRTAPDLAGALRQRTVVARKLNRAAIETLAVIAYHQPVTRAEIEEIRGVAVSKGTVDALLEATWIRPAGRRRTPGLPTTWATTQTFLDHFGLARLEDLPGLEELRQLGLLDGQPGLPLGDPTDASEEQVGDDPATGDPATGDPAAATEPDEARSPLVEGDRSVDDEAEAPSLFDDATFGPRAAGAGRTR